MPDLQFDVCVVGAGTVGLFTASRLAIRGLRVAVIEADPGFADLVKSRLRYEPSGAPRHSGSVDGWTSGIGGTTQWWGGQLWPWERHEFDGRPELGIQEWPATTADEVRRTYRTVLRHLGLADAHHEVHQGALDKRRDGAAVRTAGIRHSTWMNRTERQFGLNRALGRAAVHCAAYRFTVDRIEPDSTGWIVLGASADGFSRSLTARRVVLAAGTLGNVSILSRSSVGDDLPTLGTGFMDHVSATVAEFEIVDAERFRQVAAPAFHRGVLGSVRLVASDVFQQSTLPAYGHWQISPPDWVPLDQAKRALATRSVGPLLRAVLPAVPHLPELGGAVLSGAIGRHRPVLSSSNVQLRIDVQQPVRRENRLIADGNGLTIQWSVGAEERQAISRHASALLSDIDESRLGARLVGTEISEPEDIFHMMGGTSMAAAGGVATSAAGVEGAPGLHLAGASLFPNGGMANPTFTALCLAELLASRLESS